MNNKQQIIKKILSDSVRGIIFDFDGTLLDVKGPLERAVKEIFEELSKNPSDMEDMDTTIEEFGVILESIQGYPLPKVLLQSHSIFKFMTSLTNISFLKKIGIFPTIISKYNEYSKEASLFSGTVNLLKYLRKKFDLFIVSHNKTDDIKFHLQKNNIEKFFKGIYGADKLPYLKPDSRVFQPLLESNHYLIKDKFVVIGNMPTDIEAGKEAGFWTIGVTNGAIKKEILAESFPDLLIDSLNDLLKLIKKNLGFIPNTITNKLIKINNEV